MLLRELIYQHVYDSDAPARLDVESQVSVIKVPAGAASSEIQDLVLSTLYPTQTPHATRMALAGADEAKVAAVFEHRKRSYRILRRADPESLRLQVKESSGWRDLAAGSVAVDERLSQSLGRPDFEVFWALNLWRFERSSSQATTFDLDALDPKMRDVVLKFRLARAVETVEDALKSTESRIAERTKELGQGAALEDKLHKAKERLVEIEVSELSPKDLELLKEKDSLMQEFDFQLNRLEEQGATEKHQIDLIVPDTPTRTAPFWGGLVLAIGSLIWAATDPSLRVVAFADVVGFGLVAWVLFNYFDGMERASLHQVRLESIKRRLNQVREEQVATNERINHVLIHAGVRDAKEMGERIEKAEGLTLVIEKMERRVQELRRDAGYMSALEDLERLKKRQVELVAERRELPEDTLSSFQLESDLRSMGIDPQLVLEDTADSSPEEDEGPLQRLLSSAAIMGQWDAIELYPKTRKMWGKICGHVLGDKFSEVGVTSEGTLQIGDLDPEQIQMWRKTRPSEYEVLLRGLALAIQVGSDERSRRGMFESLVIVDPASYLTAVQGKKLQEVFASAAQRTGVVILEQ